MKYLGNLIAYTFSVFAMKIHGNLVHFFAIFRENSPQVNADFRYLL